MAKDEELLLGLEKDSDSDDVVEEFKLPPPRSRRKRGGKGIPEARIASGASLVTWRCCFSFILLSIVLSGGLVLAYFIYNMHIQLYNVKDQLSITTADANTVLNGYRQKIKTLEDKHQTFIEFQEKHNAIVKKIQADLEEVKQNGGGGREDTGDLSHRITTLETDVESLKSGMAKEGVSIDKTMKYVVNVEDKMKDLQKDVSAMKVEFMNPTKTREEEDNDSDQPSESSDYMTRSEVNSMFKKFSDNQIDENTQTTKQTLSDIANLKALYNSVNVTHNFDLLRLTRSVVQIKKDFESFKDSYVPIIKEVKNATTNMIKRFFSHENHVSNMEGRLNVVNATISQLQSVHQSLQSIQPTPSTSTLPKTTTRTGDTSSHAASLTSSLVTTTTSADVNVGADQTITTAVTPTPMEEQATTTTAKISSSQSTSTTFSKASASNNGPLLPDETGIYKTAESTASVPTFTPTTSTVAPSAASSTPIMTTDTPSHVYSSIPTEVHEQTAKEGGEASSDYNKFQKNPPKGENPSQNPSSNGDSEDSSQNPNSQDPNLEDPLKSQSSSQQSENEKREGSINPLSHRTQMGRQGVLTGESDNQDSYNSYQRRRPLNGPDEYEDEDNSYNGLYSNGEEKESYANNKNSQDNDNSEAMARALRMIKNSGERLSDSQKREIVQRFLAAQGNKYPYNSGD